MTSRLGFDRCTQQIFEFLTGEWLFVLQPGPTWTAEQYHLVHIPGVISISRISDTPRIFRTASMTRVSDSSSFDPLFVFGCTSVPRVVSLQRALANYGVVSDADADV
jgi:hypothetical protein